MNSCCGGYSKKIKVFKSKLPPNPKVENGIPVIYIGSGDEKFIGKATGNSYYASDHQRHFKIDREDYDSILANKEVILKP